MSDLVQLTKMDGVAVVTINNPPVNALRAAVSAGIAAAVAQIEQDDGVMAAVFIGAGRTSVGLKKVCERVREFQQRLGNWWEPAPLMQRLAQQDKTFAEFSSRHGVAA